MLHREQFPEKPQYNMATPPPISRQPLPPPFCLTLPFLAKIFRPPPISINFEKVDPPPLGKGENGEIDFSKLIFRFHLPETIYRVK